MAGVAIQAINEFSKTKKELADAIMQIEYSGGVTRKGNSGLEARIQGLIAKIESDTELLLASRQAMAKLMMKDPYNSSNSSYSS